MKKNILICFLIGMQTVESKKITVCSVPFADLTVEQNVTKKKNPKRISQLLLNDQVEIIDTTETEYKITLDSQAYGTYTGAVTNSYWVTQSALSTVEQTGSKKTGFLIRPLFLSPIDATVSAGTSFDIAQETDSYYIGWFMHPATKKYTRCTLEKKNCCIPYTDPIKQKKAFVQLVTYWARQHPEKIPYALGGSTIIHTIDPALYDHPTINKKGSCALQEDNSCLYTGIDCAHLIYLAARITGIPVITTNTLGQAQELLPFTKNDTLEAGDIALWKGHVVVITDPSKGLLAEARGYEQHYGIVHEIPFSEQFVGIQTGKDLVAAYLNKTPIARLNKAGNVVQTITDMRLYKLPVGC